MAKLSPLALALCALVLLPAPARAAPPVWIVKDADSTIVLFGSVHILPEGLDWQPPALKAALPLVDDLWFEIPTDVATAAKVSDLALHRAMLPPGQTLSALLDKTARARLARVAGKLNLSVTALDGMKPWMAEVQLTVSYLQSRGAAVDQGVEQRVSALAPASAQRRSFETAEEQVDILSGATMDVQVASLKETLKEIETDPGGFDRMLKIWMSGDARRLAHEALDPMKKATPQIYKSLVLDRNIAWVAAIRERLKGSGRTVMVVGAGHLVGVQGVPALLRAQGVTVEGP